MAVPKGKTSKARKRTRRAANWKLSNPGITTCPHCKKPMLAHRVCKNCGYYDGQQVVAVDTAAN